MPARIFLRPPTAADQAQFLARAVASRRLHGRWVQAPATPRDFRAYLARAGEANHCAMLVCDAATGEIAGAVTASQIVLGPLRSAYLGYYAFEGFEGRGLMREAVQAMVRHAFRRLGLHRLEANIQPENLASIALVRACGFRQEGFSPRYLKIAGRWRDHERWAILAS